MEDVGCRGRGRVTVTEHLPKLLLNLAVRLGVGAQQMYHPVHRGRRRIVSLRDDGGHEIHRNSTLFMVFTRGFFVSESTLGMF